MREATAAAESPPGTHTASPVGGETPPRPGRAAPRAHGAHGDTATRLRLRNGPASQGRAAAVTERRWRRPLLSC